MAQNITLTMLQALKWARKNEKLGTRVLAARINAEETRRKVDAYIRPIFDKYEFTVTLDKRLSNYGQPITNMRDVYLSSDDDKFAKYVLECHEANKAHGYDVQPGYCPALMAENAVALAETELVKSGAELMKPFDSGHLFGEKRTRFVKLLLDLIAQV